MRYRLWLWPVIRKQRLARGRYVFCAQSSAQTLKALIFEANLSEGYTLDSDNQLQFRFSKPAQMPVVDVLLMASSMCKGMTTRKVWTYTLVELNGTTKVTVQPVWEYPDDYCQIQTQGFIWGRPEDIAAFQAMLDKAPTSRAKSPKPASQSVASPSAPTSDH